MTMNEKQGAAEWLRGIADKCQSEDGFGCREIVEMLGFCCDEIEMCNKCRVKAMKAIADRIDAERALPEGVEWPRLEDGEPVKVGDEVEYKGETMRVCSVTFVANGWSLRCERRGVDGVLYGSFGERVKRPAPKVLAANGAPIEVGDTVYLRSNGREGKVVGFYEDKGETWVSVSYELGSDRMTVNTEGKALTHERPDSWERIEEDAYSLVMSEYIETPEEDVRDIVRRAKALAKREVG